MIFFKYKLPKIAVLKKQVVLGVISLYDLDRLVYTIGRLLNQSRYYFLK